MTTSKLAEPRRHHYVPRCWLAGFTDTGNQDGKLFVTDFKRRNQWGAVPGTAGFIRDFYRLEDEHASDPVMVEKAFSQIEDAVAPLLRDIDREMRPPTVEEMEPLLYFMAIQWSRVPAFRPLVLGVLDKLSSEQITKELESPEPDEPGADYKRMKEFHEAKAYTLTAPTDWYVEKAFKAVGSVLPGLQKRLWTTLISPTGSFVANDNPVILEGARGALVGFENAELISYAVSRHVALWGTLLPVRPPLVNRKFIASLNTLALLRAEDHVFSNIPDFCWLDEHRREQTEWKLFSKDKY